MEYQVYLASPHWRDTRKAAIERARYRCEECAAHIDYVYLEVHHLHYHTVGNERPEDLQVLCKPCHRIAHGLPPAQPQITPGFVAKTLEGNA